MQKDADPRAIGGKRQALSLAFSFTLDALLADQLTKYFLFANQELLSKSWLGGLISFIEHRNYGISFNIPLPLIVTIVITLGVIGFAWKRFIETPTPKLLMSIGLGLLTGGALGNLLDRLWLGYVRDWLLLGGQSAVNVADGLVILGLILFLVSIKSDRPVASS